VAFTQELSLLLGFFLFSATLFGVPSEESNFTVDEYGKRHYVLVPENTNTGFLEELSTIVSKRYSSEHKIFDYDELTVDSESLLSFPSVSSLLFFEPGPEGTPRTVDSTVDFEFNPSFMIIENDSDLTGLENSQQQETTIGTPILILKTRTNDDYHFNQMQIAGQLI
jgi:hypothetical protein